MKNIEFTLIVSAIISIFVANPALATLKQTEDIFIETASYKTKGRSSLADSQPVYVYEQLACDPLPDEHQVVRPSLTNPVASLMNLYPLYKVGLSGYGQIGAVIESGLLRTPPGMSGVIMNSIESYHQDDHASMVAQVIGSRIPGIGIVPGARVFLGSSQAKLNDEISITHGDAIKLAIRAGAKAINLSFHQFKRDNPFFEQRKKQEKSQKEADYDLISAITMLLSKVFLCLWLVVMMRKIWQITLILKAL